MKYYYVFTTDGAGSGGMVCKNATRWKQGGDGRTGENKIYEL